MDGYPQTSSALRRLSVTCWPTFWRATSSSQCQFLRHCRLPGIEKSESCVLKTMGPPKAHRQPAADAQPLQTGCFANDEALNYGCGLGDADGCDGLPVVLLVTGLSPPARSFSTSARTWT
jgi:hypothetical protein